MRDYVGYIKTASGEEKEFLFSCPKNATAEQIEAAGLAAMQARRMIDWWYIAADDTINPPEEQASELHCAACGCDMVWPHPEIANLYVSSSCYIPGCALCYDCMRARCNATNCDECGMKKGSPCIYTSLIEGEE
ncbi:MAG: hypothetical protein PHC80_02830 [Eubacteriales bacterium]|nr:hypothetical protein [Eubacteriales bacterium]